MHADLRMVSHESALCTIGCEYISLRSFVRHSHCEGFCPRGHGLASAWGSSKAFERIWHGQNLLIFMHFHAVLFGKQHESWSKQHNGKVRKAPVCNLLLIPTTLLNEIAHEGV